MSEKVAPVRWGFIGAGMIAKKALYPALQNSEWGEIYAVAGKDAQRAKALSPSGRFYTDYQEIIDDPNVEAIYISLPNSLHIPWSIKAMEAGKDVLCEKPLTTTLEEATALLDHAVRAKKVLFPAHNYKHAPVVKAIVLVGGEGTRLRPLTYSTPKPLLPIANVAFIERQLSWLAQHGVTEVTLSLGYLPDAFIEHFAGDRFGDLTLRYAVEDEPLGTAGAIRFAADGIDERLIVCNGDVLTDLDLGGMLAFHAERGAEATIALTRVDDPSAFGVVPTREDGEVIAFVEKPPPGQDRKSTRLNSSHVKRSRMPSSA